MRGAKEETFSSGDRRKSWWSGVALVLPLVAILGGFVRSYTRSGFANIFVNLKGSMRGDAVKEAFYQARKKIGDIRQALPDGVINPFCNEPNGAWNTRVR